VWQYLQWRNPKHLRTLSSLTGYASLQVLLRGLLCHKGSVDMQCHHVQSGLCCSCTQVAKIWAYICRCDIVTGIRTRYPVVRDTCHSTWNLSLWSGLEVCVSVINFPAVTLSYIAFNTWGWVWNSEHVHVQSCLSDPELWCIYIHGWVTSLIPETTVPYN